MDFQAKAKKKAFFCLYFYDLTQMTMLIVKVHLRAIICFQTIENSSLNRVCKRFEKMFANFLQITVNSQKRKTWAFDLNNIGKGDFFVTCEKLGQILCQKLSGGVFAIISVSQKLDFQIYQKII